MVPALDIERLGKSYRAGIAGCYAAVRALADVSLLARPGEVVGVYGGDGAGKSTLLLCAAAALRPDSGEVRWFGAPAVAGERAARGVGFVADCPDDHAFLTAWQSLEHAAARARRQHDVRPLLRRTTLVHEPRCRVRDLPTGARRELAVAHALLARPRLLLVDGPFDGVGAAWATSLALLLRAAAADGVACVVTASDYDALRPVADRVVTLAEGHLPAAGCRVAAAAQGTWWRIPGVADDAARVAEAR
ncbi:MAG TPA: ATP-binding cassette domain-containing protein [Gemmatimonadaceae bacterium]|nr:ATP-binding cassette domain-containing protein [Gemmatimonadaceae bacterium]